MAPKISVVVPVYNCAKYLPAALASVDAQTLSLKDYETIVLNDGSTDASFDIAKSWADKRSNARVYSNECNKGLPTSKNRAIEFAEGEYVALLDSDDLIVPGALEKSLDFISRNPDASYAYSAHQRMTADGKFLCNRPSQEFSFDDLFHYNFVSPMKVFSRKVHGDVGGFDSAILYAEDWEHALKFALLDFGRGMMLNSDNLYRYRWHSESMSHADVSKKDKFICGFLQEHLRSRGIRGKVFRSHETSEGYNYFDWTKDGAQ